VFPVVPGPGSAEKNAEKTSIRGREMGGVRLDFPITAEQQIKPMADAKNRRTSGECASSQRGRLRPLFRTVTDISGAAEGKVPLLMVCVKREPQHLVFYLAKGESRSIIPGFCLWRIMETRVNRGLERCRGEGRLGRHDFAPGMDLR